MIIRNSDSIWLNQVINFAMFGSQNTCVLGILGHLDPQKMLEVCHKMAAIHPQPWLIVSFCFRSPYFMNGYIDPPWSTYSEELEPWSKTNGHLLMPCGLFSFHTACFIQCYQSYSMISGLLIVVFAHQSLVCHTWPWLFPLWIYASTSALSTAGTNALRKTHSPALAAQQRRGAIRQRHKNCTV